MLLFITASHWSQLLSCCSLLSFYWSIHFVVRHCLILRFSSLSLDLYQINYWINLFLLTEPSNSLLFITVSLLVSRIKLGHIKSFFQTNVLLAWSVLRMLTFVSCLTELLFLPIYSLFDNKIGHIPSSNFKSGLNMTICFCPYTYTVPLEVSFSSSCPAPLPAIQIE